MMPLRRLYLNETKTHINEDIMLINLKMAAQKAKLEKEVFVLKNKVQPLREALNKGISDSIEELRAKKQLAQLENETKKREEALFFEQMHLEADAEKQIDDLKDARNLKVEMHRLFQVHVQGKNICSFRN